VAPRSNSTQPMTERTTNTEPVFTRRKFTITETLNSELDGLAERHYQGNVSLCIRAAIEDHIQTLEGDGDVTTRRLIARVEDVSESQQVLLHKLTALESELEADGQHTTEVHQGTDNKLLPPSDQQVLEAVAAAEAGLHVDDLLETLDMPKERTLAALGSLIDRGYVFRVDPNSDRYQTPGTQPSRGGELE